MVFRAMPHRRAMQEVHQGSSSFWGRLAQNEQVQRKNHIDHTQIYGLLCGLNVAIPCSFFSISALATQQSAWRVCPHKSAYMMAGLWDLSQTLPSTFCTHDLDSQTWLTYQASCSELGKSTAARCKGLSFARSVKSTPLLQSSEPKSRAGLEYQSQEILLQDLYGCDADTSCHF